MTAEFNYSERKLEYTTERDRVLRKYQESEEQIERLSEEIEQSIEDGGSYDILEERLIQWQNTSAIYEERRAKLYAQYLRDCYEAKLSEILSAEQLREFKDNIKI